MKNLLSIGIIMMFPALASAQKTAVLQGGYLLVLDDGPTDARARIVSDRVCRTIKNDGLECMRINETCPDKECLTEKLKENQTDEAIAVSVEQIGAEYKLHLFSAKGVSAETEITGPMSDALDALEELVRKSFVEPLKNPSEPEPATESQKAAVAEPGPPKNEASEAALPVPSIAPKSMRKRFGPAPFWIAVGVLGAAAVSVGVIEGIGCSRWQDFLDKALEDRTASEKKSLTHLRAADWAMMGVSAAGLAAMIVIAPFTDFKREKKADVALAPIPGGGALLIGSEF